MFIWWIMVELRVNFLKSIILYGGAAQCCVQYILRWENIILYFYLTLGLSFEAGSSQHTTRHIFSFTKKKKVSLAVQHLFPISHTFTLTYTPAIPLNVTGSAERSVDAKGSEALGSILHHFSQLGHIYSPQVIVHLWVILSAFLASLQMSRGPGRRGRQSEIKIKGERRIENEREMKVGGVWAKHQRKGGKVSRFI